MRQRFDTHGGIVKGGEGEGMPPFTYNLRKNGNFFSEVPILALKLSTLCRQLEAAPQGVAFRYLGDVRPSERSFKRNSQYAKALDEVVRAGDALTDTLTEKQKELFEDYMTAQREVNVLTDCETFIYSFRLAAKIMIDVLTDGQMREI